MPRPPRAEPRSSALALAALAALAALSGLGAPSVGCARSGGVASDAGGDVYDPDVSPLVPDGGREACEAVAAAHCEALARCLPDSYARVLGVDQAACVALTARPCLARIDDPGVVLSVDGLSRCASSLVSLSCPRFLRATGENSGAATPECAALARGTRSDGSNRLYGAAETCAADGQCWTGYCEVGFDRACGRCAARVSVGAACLESSPFACPLGAQCVAGKCASYVEAGAACGDAAPCHADLACRAGVCGARAASGEACDASARDPGCARDLFCNASTGRCEPIGRKAKDEACGINGKGGLDGCVPAMACQITDADRFTGTCVPRVPEGQVCGFEGPFDSQCAYPFACLDGVCRLRDGSRC